MRILTFLHSFEPGGVERVALRLVRRWTDIGVDAALYMGREDGALHDELASDLDYRVPRPGFSTARFETLWMICTLPRIIGEIDPDILFCAGNTYTIVAVLMKILLGRRCPPIVAKVSNDLVLPGVSPISQVFYRLWLRLQRCFIDEWVVMHPAMLPETVDKEDFKVAGVIPDPALTSRQIEELRRWRPRSADGPGRRFVAMGRLAKQKNYSLMVRAFASVAKDDDCLTIYGAGPQRKALEELAASLGIGDRVRFAGHVEWSADCFIGQDALLLSSAYEGVPAILLEAMTCGMPILATRCGPGVEALLADYPAAHMVASGDLESFSTGIRTLSLTPAQGRESFDPERYTVEAGADSYLDVFAKTLRSRPGRRGSATPVMTGARV